MSDLTRLFSLFRLINLCYLPPGPTEPVHCLHFYRDSLLSATTANKIGVHSTLEKNASNLHDFIRFCHCKQLLIIRMFSSLMLNSLFPSVFVHTIQTTIGRIPWSSDNYGIVTIEQTLVVGSRQWRN